MMFFSRALAVAAVVVLPTDASIRSKLQRQMNEWGDEWDSPEDVSYDQSLNNPEVFEMLAMFSSDFEDCGVDLGVLLGDETTGGPPDPMQMLQDIKLSPPCSATEKETLRQSLLAFQECSGYEAVELDEDIFGAMMGAFIKCASSLTILDLAAMDIPEQCATAFLGNHPMGQAFRDILLHPGETSQCFLELSHSVPDCSVDLWPFPLDGKSIQTGACISSKIDTMINDQCIESLTALDSCLPASKGEITASSCESSLDSCTGTESMYTTVIMMMPPHLQGMPLPSSCSSAAMSKGLGSVVERYETFRSTCAETGSKMWADLEAGKGPTLETIANFMHSGSTPSNAKNDEKEEPAEQVLEEKNEVGEQKTLTNAQQTFDNDNSGKSSSSGATFGFGMLSGVALLGLIYAAVVVDLKRRSNGSSVMTAVGSLELGDFSGAKYSDVPASEMT